MNKGGIHANRAHLRGTLNFEVLRMYSCRLATQRNLFRVSHVAQTAALQFTLEQLRTTPGLWLSRQFCAGMDTEHGPLERNNLRVY